MAYSLCVRTHITQIWRAWPSRGPKSWQTISRCSSVVSQPPNSLPAFSRRTSRRSWTCWFKKTPRQSGIEGGRDDGKEIDDCSNGPSLRIGQLNDSVSDYLSGFAKENSGQRVCI